MKEIKIEKNVELPPRYQKICKKYPFDKMEVGDSFFVNYEEEHPRNVQSKVSASITKYSKEYKVKYTLRSLEKGVRVWRIK